MSTLFSRHKTVLLFAGLVFSSCSSETVTSKEPSSIPTPDSPFPGYIKIGEFDPEESWEDDNIVFIRDEASFEAVKDLVKYFESGFRARNTTLTHGYIPTVHLENSRSIDYFDDTEGVLPGMEKIKTVFPRMYERCPILKSDKLQAPLHISWNGRTSLGEENWKSTTAGLYIGPAITFWEDRGEIFLEDTHTFAPDHTIIIWGEKKDFYGWPKQLHSEIWGHEAWETPVDEDDRYFGGATGPSMDQVFAHEYGHHFFSAWAMNHGRSLFHTRHFSEGLAEIFAAICYGTPHESPFVVEQYRSQPERLTMPFIQVGALYFPYEFDRLITWEALHDNLDPEQMFDAVLRTLEAMEGRLPRCYPEDLRQVRRCSWEYAEAYPVAYPERFAPLSFTRGEFAERFCDNYDCPEEFKDFFTYVSETLREKEW